MKTMKLAGTALAVPIAAAITMTVALIGPKQDIWGLGNAMLIILIGGPLTVAAPFVSLAGTCCATYAMRHAPDSTTAKSLLAANGLLLVLGAVAAATYLYWIKNPG